MIEELISKALATRNYAHLEHWATKSYARHKALNSFYDDLLEAIDELVECYQGMFGRVSIKLEQGECGDIANHLQEEADWIEANRAELSGGSDSIGNLIDNLVNVYAKTVYLLTLK